MGLTLVEAEKLFEGMFHKERMKTHGLERVLRWLFHRPKYGWVSALMKWLEEDSVLEKLAFEKIKGYEFICNRERVKESSRENEVEETGLA